MKKGSMNPINYLSKNNEKGQMYPIYPFYQFYNNEEGSLNVIFYLSIYLRIIKK